MNDLFGKDLELRRWILSKAISIFENHGFSQMQSPVLEELKLFVRSVGEDTDIVSKEMYTLEDKDGTMICMRPEGTAGAVRALLSNNKLAQEQDAKVFYIEPMFRRERPQKGRLREFLQIGAEFIGPSEASADIEIISMIYQWLCELPIGQIKLIINSLGQPNERKAYLADLKKFYTPKLESLCFDCQRRINKNILRLLDCKNQKCSELSKLAPSILDYLGEESKSHFEQVKSGLNKLNINFEVSNRMVRGIDYYTRTVFEFIAESGLGAQNTVAAGGRYDNLVEELGGPKAPACGFAAGLERLEILMLENGFKLEPKRPELSLIYADKIGREKALELLYKLRHKNLWVDFEHKAKSVKAQMRRADRMNSKEALVLGQREVDSGKAQIKFLETGESREINLSELY